MGKSTADVVELETYEGRSVFPKTRWGVDPAIDNSWADQDALRSLAEAMLQAGRPIASYRLDRSLHWNCKPGGRGRCAVVWTATPLAVVGKTPLDPPRPIRKPRVFREQG